MSADPLYPPPVVHAFPYGQGAETFRDDAWSQLIKGRALGKRIVMPYDAEDTDAQIAPIEFFQLGSLQRDAVQMQIVISSPTAIPRTQASLEGIAIQDATGEYLNAAIGNVDYPGTGAPIVWPPLSVLIEWGVNARVHAIVDAKNGTSINISASWVRCLGLYTADAANQPGTSGLYVMSAFPSPGWPSAPNAQRTVYLGSVNAGMASDVFAVPTFAKKATIIGQDPSGTSVTTGYLNFWQSPDGSHCVGSYFISGNQPGPFSVPNGAQYFSIISGAGAAIPFAVVFDLAI